MWRTGKCTCRVGFGGQACQYMSCPDNGMCSGEVKYTFLMWYVMMWCDVMLKPSQREGTVLYVSNTNTIIRALVENTFIRGDDMWWDETRWYEMRWDEMRWDEMIWDEMIWDWCLTMPLPLHLPTLFEGHGRCADMQELAVAATVNGDKAYFTYGNDPNNADTWDANR